MAPKKAKSKLKKVLSPPQPALPQEDLVDDDALMDDLLAQLDSKDEVVREETATVLQEMQVNKVAEELGSAPKKDSKARFKARQVRPLPRLSRICSFNSRVRRRRQLRLLIATHPMTPKPTRVWSVKPKKRKPTSNACVMSSDLPCLRCVSYILSF